MSHENVELAYRALDSFNRRDLDGFLAVQAENVRADPRLAAVEGGYHSHDGIRRWWKSLFDGIPDFTMDVVEVRDLADDLVLAVATRGHGAESATPFEDTIWVPIRFRRGKVRLVGRLLDRRRSPRSRRGAGVAARSRRDLDHR